MATWVLVVDDNEFFREALVTVLEAWGFQARSADGALAGIDVLHDQPGCGLVLLDWHMPDMDGGDFLRMIRADSVTATIPVVVLTSDLCAHVAYAAGATAFLHKLMSSEALVTLVKRLMEAKNTTGWGPPHCMCGCHGA